MGTASKRTKPAAPAQPEPAAQQDKRITPALWMPAAPTIAWLAFSSAETDWDANFYFGASIWYAADPDRVLTWLQDVEERGDLLDDVEPSDLQHLHRHIRNVAAQTGTFQTAKAEYAAAKESGRKSAPLSISGDHIREAASILRTALERKKSDAQRTYDAIWEGSETLRRALAGGDLTACGWPGLGPDLSDNTGTLPLREPIPRDVFSRPVTVTQAGVLAFARGDESFGYDHDRLWSGLLFDAHDLRALHELPEDGRPSVPYTPPEQVSRKGVGGRPDLFDWNPFNRELVRYLVLDAQDPTQASVREYMKEWANMNMGTSPPSDRTIERRIDLLVIKDIYVG